MIPEIREKYRARRILTHKQFRSAYEQHGLNLPVLRKLLDDLDAQIKEYEHLKKVLEPKRQFKAIYIPLGLSLCIVLLMFLLRERFEIVYGIQLGIVVLSVLSFAIGIRHIVEVFQLIMKIKEDDESFDEKEGVSADTIENTDS